MLRDFRRVVVVGASGGIGRALEHTLRERYGVDEVISACRTKPDRRWSRGPLVFIDLEDEATIEAAAQEIGAELDGVIVATGVLHSAQRNLRPEKSLKQLEASRLMTSFGVNAIGPILVAKYFTPLLTKQRRSVFAALSARVGSIDDNRIGGWYGYRASKAALNQFLKTAAIEFRRTHPQLVCVGLHPGTVDTALSKPFQASVPDGHLFEPKAAAEKLLRVVDTLALELSGAVLDWSGKVIPP